MQVVVIFDFVDEPTRRVSRRQARSMKSVTESCGGWHLASSTHYSSYRPRPRPPARRQREQKSDGLPCCRASVACRSRHTRTKDVAASLESIVIWRRYFCCWLSLYCFCLWAGGKEQIVGWEIARATVWSVGAARPNSERRGPSGWLTMMEREGEMGRRRCVACVKTMVVLGCIATLAWLAQDDKTIDRVDGRSWGFHGCRPLKPFLWSGVGGVLSLSRGGFLAAAAS
ncbi:hypothetical protein BKA80DRAFT_36574 [Phyllosticta citrichinensis]